MGVDMIPEMTCSLGRYWDQPSRDRILVDQCHALMTEGDFTSLKEYSASHPSGVYPGKMWRRHDGAHDPRCPPEKRRWMLCWYGDEIDGSCRIHFREVLLT